MKARFLLVWGLTGREVEGKRAAAAQLGKGQALCSLPSLTVMNSLLNFISSTRFFQLSTSYSSQWLAVHPATCAQELSDFPLYLLLFDDSLLLPSCT